MEISGDTEERSEVDRMALSWYKLVLARRHFCEYLQKPVITAVDERCPVCYSLGERVKVKVPR